MSGRLQPAVRACAKPIQPEDAAQPITLWTCIDGGGQAPAGDQALLQSFGRALAGRRANAGSEVRATPTNVRAGVVTETASNTRISAEASGAS